MGFRSGAVTVTSGSATLLVAPSAASAITLHYLGGGGSVTIGGPGVTAGQGPSMAAGSLPIAIQATHFGNIEDADDGLYGITGSGSAVIGWIHGV
jgi:hypothetical protein